MTPAAVALATFAALAGAACRKASPEVTASEGATSAAPVDRAAPGELAEGTERAFGLPIPRRMRVEARFPDAVIATGDIPPELVMRYVRDRIQTARLEAGPARTVFAEARLRAPAAEAPDSGADRVVRIEVAARGGGTELVVRDQTRPPATEGLTPDDRWKKHGLTPDGKPIDPTHLE